MNEKVRQNMVKGCSKCPTYDKELSRCRMGYVNPPTIKGGLEGMKLGMLKPCPYTDKGQKVKRRYMEWLETQGNAWNKSAE